MAAQSQRQLGRPSQKQPVGAPGAPRSTKADGAAAGQFQGRQARVNARQRMAGKGKRKAGVTRKTEWRCGRIWAVDVHGRGSPQSSRSPALRGQGVPMPSAWLTRGAIVCVKPVATTALCSRGKNGTRASRLNGMEKRGARCWLAEGRCPAVDGRATQPPSSLCARPPAPALACPPAPRPLPPRVLAA